MHVKAPVHGRGAASSRQAGSPSDCLLQSMTPGELAGFYLNVILPIAFLVAAGGVWKHLRGSLAAETLRGELGRLVINLFAPALVFSVVASAPVDRALFQVPLIVGLATLAGGGVLYLLLFVSPMGRSLADTSRAALLLAGMFGNILYFGLPLMSFLYGPGGDRYPLFADNLATSPLVWTLGVWVATRLGSHHREEGRGYWKTLLRLPPIWAFVISAACNVAHLPVAPLVRAARLVGAPTVPLMLMVVGLAVPWGNLRAPRAVWLVALVKLILMPLIALGLVHLTAVPGGAPATAAVLEAAVPTMVLSVVLADLFKLDVAMAALTLGISTLLSLLTLPIWISILR